MARLEETAMIGGERTDAVDHCLAGIARLQKEVSDASTYVPAYDQRTYSEVRRVSWYERFEEHETLMKNVRPSKP